MNKKQQKVYLDKESRTLINTLSKTKTGSVNTSLKALSYGEFIVFKAVNISNKRVLIGIDRTKEYFNFSVLLRLTKGDNLVSEDVELYGRESFELKPLGLFPTKQAALLFRDRAINDEMDKGTTVYNNEVYIGTIPRLVTLKLPLKVAHILASMGKKKKTTLEGIIKKILKNYLKKISVQKN